MTWSVGVLLGVGYLLSAGPQTGSHDYQAWLDREPWTWDGRKANLLDCVRRCLWDYRVSVVSPGGDGPQEPRLEVRIGDGTQELHAFDAHPHTVFTRSGSVLYLVEFCPIAPGCSVMAYDFKARKRLWKTFVPGHRGPTSAYANEVTIEPFPFGHLPPAVVIKGNESCCRYAEVLDMESGKAVARREYARDEGR
jgi:hypothetical protein